MTIYIKNALTDKPLTLFDDGNQTRDFIDVSDVVEFNISALNYLSLNNHKTFHHVFNVSTGKGTKIITLAQMIKDIFLKRYGRKIAVIYDKVKQGEKSQIINRVRLPNELQNMILDNKKARSALHWNPKVTLEQGLNDQINWVEKNVNRWKKMSY